VIAVRGAALMDQQIIVVVVVGMSAKKYARHQSVIMRISLTERWSEIICTATNHRSASEVAMTGVQRIDVATMSVMDVAETLA
jgi:hypothetical protein